MKNIIPALIVMLLFSFSAHAECTYQEHLKVEVLETKVIDLSREDFMDKDIRLTIKILAAKRSASGLRVNQRIYVQYFINDDKGNLPVLEKGQILEMYLQPVSPKSRIYTPAKKCESFIF